MDGLELTAVDDGGGMLIGSWFATLSYAILLFQLGLYVRSGARDSILLKLAIGLLFCIDTTCNALLLVSTYRQLITVKPDTIESLMPPLTLICMPLVSGFEALGVNLFLVWRYQRLTKRTWLCYGLYLTSFVCAACYMWASILSIKLQTSDMSDLRKFKDSYTMAIRASKAGLSLELLMLCLVWALLFGTLLAYLKEEMLGLRRVITSLLLITAETGTVTAVMGVFQLVYFLKNRSSATLLLIGFLTTRTYFMGMMFTFNMRRSGGKLMRDSTNTPGSAIFRNSNCLPLSHISRSGETQTQSAQHKVIHVSRDVATSSDKHAEEFGQDDDNSQAFSYGGTRIEPQKSFEKCRV